MTYLQTGAIIDQQGKERGAVSVASQRQRITALGPRQPRDSLRIRFGHWRVVQDAGTDEPVLFAVRTPEVLIERRRVQTEHFGGRSLQDLVQRVAGVAVCEQCGPEPRQLKFSGPLIGSADDALPQRNLGLVPRQLVVAISKVEFLQQLRQSRRFVAGKVGIFDNLHPGLHRQLLEELVAQFKQPFLALLIEPRCIFQIQKTDVDQGVFELGEERGFVGVEQIQVHDGHLGEVLPSAGHFSSPLEIVKDDS